MILEKSPRILIIRRDNIGDLVCTTPLLHALRQRFPGAWIGLLVNSYNAPVLDRNPDLDEVFIYTKAKHRGPDKSLPGILWQRLKMLLALRRLRVDDILIATTSWQPRTVRLAHWLKAKRVIGFADKPMNGLDVTLLPAAKPLHEVEDVFRLARLYGIEGEPPALQVFAPAASVHGEPRIAIHISARKPSQRWPGERYAALMRMLHAQHGARFVLLWSPGSNDNPLHPGDDEKAADILHQLGNDFPLEAIATTTLTQLIAALSTCDAMVCSDGGAMHLAAGLGLPIVCLFGNSGAMRWRPWGVPYRLLQKESLEVIDIGVTEVISAFNELPLRGGRSRG